MRVYRLPHESENELEYLRGRSKSRVPLEAAPRQAHTFECIVENDPAVLGDQKRSFHLAGCQKEFGDGVCGEISRYGFHDNNRPVTLKGLRV